MKCEIVRTCHTAETLGLFLSHPLGGERAMSLAMDGAPERAETSRADAGQDRRLRGFRERPRHRSGRSEEHTSELQSLMRISYAVFCLKKKKRQSRTYNQQTTYQYE